MKDCSHCSGCYNNFYNDNNPYGVKRCWSLPTARMVTKFKLYSNVPMWIHEAYRKVRVPSCYHENGVVYLNAIPDYAKTPEQRKEVLANEGRTA